MKLLSVLLLSFSLSLSAWARDEDFGIFQFRKNLPGDHQVLLEYVRRDRGELFQEKFLDLYRLSWGGKVGAWTYLLGGGYVDFEKGADEKRYHQFFIRNFSEAEWLKGFVRLGLEERTFIGEEKIHLRGRVRVQANVLSSYGIGPSLYNETFYTHDGQGRFVEGFNENRLGVGLRYALPGVEIFVFHVSGYLQTLKSSDRFEWAQIQTAFSF